MHYDVDYSKLTDDEKHKQAIADIKDFWETEERYNDLTAILKREVDPTHYAAWHKFAMAMSFAGIQGYPVKALYKEIFGVEPTITEE